MSSTLVAIGVLATVSALASGAARAADNGDEDIYQISKATADRVWRLNKRTGEIAVCTLDGVNLICSTSTKAVSPPARTYEELEAEKKQAAADAEKRRQIEKAKDLEFLDRVIAAFRILIGAAIERDSGN